MDEEDNSSPNVLVQKTISKKQLKNFLKRPPNLIVILFALLGVVSVLVSLAATSSSPSMRTITPPPPSDGSTATGTVGYIGCSNTEMTVNGYHQTGGNRLWPGGLDYGNGTLSVWASQIGSSTGYWGIFEQQLSANPTTEVVWIQFCLKSADSNDTVNYNNAVAVINEVNRLIPGATIYVSALNGYVSPHVCSISGRGGTAKSQTIVNTLVSGGKAQAGAKVGSLLSIYQTPSTGATSSNNQTETDGCHPNSAGQLYLGGNLKTFFN